MIPEDTKLVERQREHFNSIADRYQVGRTASNHLLLKALMWSDVFSRFRELKGKRLDVLEPMCGFCDGYNLVRDHLSPDVRYKGFDYSDTVVASVKEANPELDVWQADATIFKPEVASADVIILIGGLHHTPRAARDIVRNLVPGLRSGGLFVNYEPTHGNRLFKFVRDRIYRKNSLFDEQTERAFSVDELRAFFLDAGMVPALTCHPGLLSYVLYYNPDAFPALNVGGQSMVRALYSIDKLFYENIVGKTLSFATLTAWRKP